jgi:DNA-directed RNA polymerase subunit RPC12/RpoP
LKCPDCNSQVDHSSLVNGPKGEEYYVCSSCERQLVHQMSFGKVILISVFALPVLWFLLDLLLAVLIGPIVGDAMIFGFEAVEMISIVVSIIIVAVLVKYSIRLVEQ